MILDGIIDKLFKALKPIEDLTYKYYDNDYMIYLAVGLILLFFIALVFFLFKIGMAIIT